MNVMNKTVLKDTQLLEEIVSNVTDAIVTIDEAGTITFINHSTARMFGYSESELVGCKVNILMPEPMASSHDQYIENYLSSGEGKVIGVGPRELKGLHKNGSLIDIEITVSETEIASRKIFIGVIRDISERVEASRKFNLLSKRDSLTGLPNRACFLDYVDENIGLAGKAGYSFIVIVIGIDRFKVINDSLGLVWGDMLLMAVADRFKEAVSADDTVSRLGGDEFAVLHKGKHADINAFVQKLQATLHEFFDFPGRELLITACMGISIFPLDGTDSDSLLQNATAALFSAKQGGTGQSAYYSADLNATSQHRLSLETELSHAIEREEFRLYYQPKVDTLTGQVLSAEALLRWQHPEKGLVSPADFIPLLEETGLIIPVGEWVLTEACRANRAWQKAGMPKIEVGVNLSARQFQLKDLSGVVTGALQSTGLEAKFLDLEITEGMLLHNIGSTVKTLTSLQEMGVSLSIDDFGTGYSSLSYLQHLPINTIKIDQSFIRNVTTEPGNMAIVRAIIAMAHNLKLKVVAEGVETIEQLAFLAKNQCDLIQGYYFSKPLPEEDFTRLLREGGHYNLEEIHGKKTQPTLLIVDDEESIRASLARVFYRDDYHVLAAGSADEAFNLLAKNEVGVIVCDQRMPVVTGSEFLSRVRSMYPDTVRIILSGYADIDAVIDGVNNGAIYKFLIKPWDDDLLRENIREAFKYYSFTRDSRKPPTVSL